MVYSGKLITLMGVDGSGKTTMLEMLQERIPSSHNVFLRSIKNPVFTNEMWAIRSKYNIPKSDYFSEAFKSLMWYQDLAWNTIANVIPLLKNGRNVILDRYTLDSRQFLEVNTGSDMFNCMADIFDSYLPKPNLAIYLKVDVSAAIRRINARGTEKAQHENEMTLSSMIDKYSSLILDENYRIDTIDANGDIESVFSEVLKSFNNVINTH